MDNNARLPFVSITITLTTATLTNIRTAINAALASANQECPGIAREVNIQSHPGIGGSGANTSDILIGDANMSATRRGYVLVVGASRLYRCGSVNAVDVGQLYAISAGVDQKLNIEVMTY